MADWTNIANTALQPGAPVRSIDGVALRDNPIAIAEGAAGAPRIAGQTGPAVQTNGIFDGAVTNAKIANSAVTNNKLQPPTAGTNFLIRRLQESDAVTTSVDYADTGRYSGWSIGSHLGVTVLVAGTITAYLQHRRRVGGGTSFVRVVRNGSQVAQWSTTSTSFQTRQVNISVAVGDVIVFQQRVSAEGNTSEWRQLRIYSNNPNFAVA